MNDSIVFFPTGLNQSHVLTRSSAGGSVQWRGTDCSLGLTTGLDPDSVACTQGYLPLYVNHEPKVKVTLNAAFNAPKDGVLQLLGMGDLEAGIFIGYNGVDFGLHVRSGGRRRYWEIKCTGTCTSAGTITLTLLGQVFTLSVSVGTTGINILYSLAQHTGLRNANILGYACFDRMFLYTMHARTWDNAFTPSIDFGGTGLTGSCALQIAGEAADEAWVYRPDFNENTRYNVSDQSPQDLNVYEFLFSRWSTGALRLSMLNIYTNEITPLHTWAQPGMGFNTSVPYAPFVFISNTTSQTEASTLRTSMATISSGTPATAKNMTKYSTTFTATNVSVVAGANTVIGMLTVPGLITVSGLSSKQRNGTTACVLSVSVNAKTARGVRLLVHVNGQVDMQSPMVPHLPWSCVRRGMPVSTTIVSGGMQFASMYLRDSIPHQEISFDQLWLVPGTSLTVSLTAVADPVTCSLDVDLIWQES